MEIPDAIINELFLNPELKKSDTRTVIFLLQNPGALSSDELAAGVRVSRKSANKSIKRLISAGIIQTGEPQAKKKAFIVHLSEPIEPPEVTGKDGSDSLSLLMEKIDRIEALLNTMTGRQGDGSASAHIHDGQNGTLIMPSLSCMENSELINGQNVIEPGHKVTQAVIIPATDGQNETLSMPVYSHVDQQKNMQDTLCPESDPKRAIEEPSFLLQDKKETVNIPKGTIGTEQGTNGTQNDSIVSVNEPSITHARTAALASFNQEKQQQQQPGAPASIGDKFHALFGVNVPVGFTDMTAVETMVSRKKAGKLDNVKSPIAYLNSLSGKVTPILAAVSPPPPAINKPLPVTETRLDHEAMSRIDAIWDAMDHSQYREKALAKDQTGKKYPVPVELLARSIFNAEMMNQGGMI
jgi:predicted transcriptional regulator